MSRFGSARTGSRAQRWRRTRLRRTGALLLAVLALWTTWAALRPSAAATVAVTVAARPIAAGTTLGSADLKIVQWPAGVVVPGLLLPAQAAGQVTTGALAAGEPVTATRLARSAWKALRPGEQAFTIPLADPQLAALLRAGDRVDLYDPATRRLVVSSARVVMSTTPKVGPHDVTAPAEPTLVIAVEQRNSAQLAGALASAATLGTGLIAAASSRT